MFTALRARMARLHRRLAGLLLPVIGVWFLSGFGMLFFRYPQLEEKVRLLRSPPLVDTTLPSWTPDCVPQRVLGDALGKTQVLCEEASPAPGWSTESYAVAAASFFLQAPPHAVSDVAVLHRVDLWTLPQRYEFPLSRVAFATPQGDVLYVSHRTGEVVHWTTKSERVKAWFGPIPHWIYVPALRRQRELWRYVVIALALLGSFVALTGLITGTSRLRRDVTGRWTSVFAKRRYLLHHFAGLAGGILVVTWSVSGALSLNPLNWSSGSTPTQRELDTWAAMAPVDRNDLQKVVDICSATTAGPLKEVVIRGVAGRPYASCSHANGVTALVELRPPYVRHSRVPREWVVHAASSIGPVLAVELIDTDAYHYSHRHEPTPAPVYRVETERLTLYVDEETGVLRSRFDRSGKLERWLYHGLHSLDFAFLYRHPTAWLLVMAVSLFLGTLVVASGGLILALRWRRRLAQTKAHRR